MFKPYYFCLFMSVFVLALSGTKAALASVSIVQGKTPIPGGNAKSDNDITIKNDKLAFSLAIGSAPPWGVARGCIVDMTNVNPDGSLNEDRVAFADFIPNNWSSWPNTYQLLDIINDTEEEAVVKLTRDFGEMLITTIYRLAAGSDRIRVTTTMTNQGEEATDLLSGFTLWPDGGYKFAVPGFSEEGQVIDNPITDRFVGYDADWAIALHAPYMSQVRYKSRDLYQQHSLKKSQSTVFEGEYQVLPSGDIAPVVKAEIQRKHLPAGNLLGTVHTKEGKSVSEPTVVVLKAGLPYVWVMGKKGQYALDLPVGDYEVYATAKGYSNSAKHKVRVYANETASLSFNDLFAPGAVSIQVLDAQTRTALDAKIQIEKGNKPLVEFLGAKTFFTQLNPVGLAQFTLAPGQYQLSVSAGGDFTAPAIVLDANIVANKTTGLLAEIPVNTYPIQQGWYSGDLHHHADVLEGSSSPEMLVRSQLAAGLSVTFVSDHDSTSNHAAIQALSDQRDVPFIPSIEISPSWGHFNAFPIKKGLSLSVDPGVDSIRDILEDAQRMGASVVATNHPYIPYGYFSSLQQNTVPGGFHPNIDLIEINSEVDYTHAINKARQLWSAGLPYYYTAGTDTHDVLNESSGHVRMFVYTGNKPNADAFAQAMKNGRSYVSFGPIIYPKNLMFGDTLTLAENQPQTVQFDLVAVSGLSSVKLIGKDGLIKEQRLAGMKASVSFVVPPQSGWLSMVVEDKKGHKAFSNPVWLKMVDKSQF
ncbi:CehA/McbA family metallohydrolase [Flavobacterium sp. W21_SRS_FM6]|uniref:CehA/McbA family metallohydrolase n=1 Tax=Flavobacterium sp. W21_SRS_FM6 TaxID=3240268 RepID=UPI003F8E386B